jgi:hypothetical protein
MNLLVTNTDAPQADDIIRALRPHARKIPLVGMLWALRFTSWVAGGVKHVGK